MFASKPNFLSFMPDRQVLALTQRVFYLLHPDFDFQQLVVIGHGKPKYRIVLRRAPRPKR